VRIIAGMARGFKLTAPSDGDGIRPTSDKVREALFNIIDVRASSFLDLCSGSGAVACEALSRGANRVAMVEENSNAVRLAEKNMTSLLKLIDSKPSTNLYRNDAQTFIESTSEIFNFIFCDPPYDYQNSTGLIEKLLKSDLLTDDGILIFESSSKRVADMPTPDRIKKYGDTSLLFYYKNKGES